jgi:hypothetical protein
MLELGFDSADFWRCFATGGGFVGEFYYV